MSRFSLGVKTGTNYFRADYSSEFIGYSDGNGQAAEIFHILIFYFCCADNFRRKCVFTSDTEIEEESVIGAISIVKMYSRLTIAYTDNRVHLETLRYIK